MSYRGQLVLLLLAANVAVWSLFVMWLWLVGGKIALNL